MSDDALGDDDIGNAGDDEPVQVAVVLDPREQIMVPSFFEDLRTLNENDLKHELSSHNFLTEELEEELQAALPDENDKDSEGKHDPEALCIKFEVVFYPGHLFINIHQLHQAVDYLADQWGFETCNTNSSIKCSYSTY
jgi:hypothetical protein